MANQLKMAMVNAILTLKQRGWSQRRIARELGINRETVARYVNLRGSDSKPATNAPTGSEGPKPAKAPIGSIGQDTQKPGPESQCESLRKVIEDKLEEGLSRQRIYQDLIDEHGFDGSYYSVRRFVNRLGDNKPIPFRRMESMPGEQAQIDFGTGAPVVRQDGKRKRPHVFRIVLSFSRKAYSEVVYRQTTDNFIRCLEDAFWHFGGIPKTLIIDNLKAAVKNADWYDPDMGIKQLPKRSGEYLFEIVMRRYETKSTIMTSNRPLEDWGKLLGDVPSATAILDRFLHHAEIITITGPSYRLKDRASNSDNKKDKAQKEKDNNDSAHKKSKPD